MFRRLSIALGLATAIAVSPAMAQEKKTIAFGIISTEAAQNLKTVWEPFLKAMSEKTGLDVQGFYASDYNGVIEAQRFDKVQVAWYGNKSGMEAVDRADGEVFAQSVAANGEQGYYSHLITHKDSPVNSLDDVLKCDKSLNFGIGDANSTSGFLVPFAYIFAAKGIDPKECFKTVRNANHEANAMAAANKQVDVAANNSENLNRLNTTAPEARKNLKVIWTSPLIPSDPIVWRKDLDADTKAKIYTFFMTFGRNGTEEEVKEARKLLATLGWSPFVPSSNGQLYPIRILELNKEIMKVKGDDKIPEAEKKTKLDELTKKVEIVNLMMKDLPRL